MKQIITGLVLFSAIIFAGCGKKTDEDYLKEAEKNIKQNKITLAIENYENLVKDYPRSKNAPAALYKLGTVYQNKLDTSIAEMDSYEKAVNTFKGIYEKYPDSKEAPMSLFMSGYILANDLKRYRDATTMYKIFLEKYPNNELAASAREELSNMGLSPDEILKKKAAQKDM